MTIMSPMIKQLQRIFLLLFIVLGTDVVFGQSQNPMLNQRWNIFDVNNIRTKFNNTGELCDGNNQNLALARPPAFEFPNGSNINYGTCVAVVVGAPADQPDGAWSGSNPENLAFADGTMNEGPADFWDQEHYAPYAEFATGQGAIMSDDSASWPQAWPALYPDIGDSLQIGPEGFPGFGPGGKVIADQESFSVMYGWEGPDHFNNATGDPPRYLNVQLINRGLAWSGSLYQNFIVWVYVIRNMGTAPIHDMHVAVHCDMGFLAAFNPPYAYGDADREYFDPDLQLAYSWDDDGSEPDPNGGTLTADEIAWGGVVSLRMPGGDHNLATYDATHFWEGQTTARGSGGAPEMYWKWNILNLNDPQDSNGDGIDDDFDEDGVPDVQNGGPNYWVASGSDGVQIIGSPGFNLAPGEGDTLIFATVFGKNQDDIKKSAKSAINLYKSGWAVVTAPPSPVVEAIPGDRKVTLVWSKNAEKDPQFEGYKIYRSDDGGITWGSQTFKDFSGGVHYIPLAQFDKEDNIKGNYQTLPEFAWFNLGDDTGLPREEVVTADADSFKYFDPGDSVRVFVDRDVFNGFKYQYYIASYDSGNGITGPLESTRAKATQEKNNAVLTIPQGSVASNSLEKIRVVPNPYVVANSFETGQDKELQFTHLPATATVYLYNNAGERVRTLHHSAAGSLAPSILTWDLKNYDNQLVAPGVYYFVVDSDLGMRRGKFVIIY